MPLDLILETQVLTRPGHFCFVLLLVEYDAAAIQPTADPTHVRGLPSTVFVQKSECL